MEVEGARLCAKKNDKNAIFQRDSHKTNIMFVNV